MLEFDIESWHRKWKGSTGILVDSHGMLFQGQYTNIEFLTDKIFIASLEKAGKYIMGDAAVHASIPMEFKGIPCAMPKYMPFESGVYHSREPSIEKIVMVKIHFKSFIVGVHSSTYSWVGFDKEGKEVNVNASSIDLLRPLEVDEFDPGKVLGALSRKVWWHGDRFMWMRKQIGFIKGWNVLLDNDFYVPFIKPLVGKKCQLSVL